MFLFDKDYYKLRDKTELVRDTVNKVNINPLIKDSLILDINQCVRLLNKARKSRG